MSIYYIETGMGCGLREARDERTAERDALREAGTYVGVNLVRRATSHDISWVRTMGGHVPESAAKASK